MSWAPLHMHSFASMLDAGQSTKQIVDFCKEQGYPACGLTNHGNLFDCMEFNKAAIDNDIKPILGCELYLSAQSAKIKSPDNRKLSHLCVLSKSYEGWLNLVKIANQSNKPEHFYYKPRLSLEELANLIGSDLIAFSGHAGSDLGNACITSMEAYRADTLDEAKQYMRNVEDVIPLAILYKDIFKTFFIEIQLVDEENIPVTRLIAEMLREVSRRTGIPCIATGDSHYTRREDAHIQRILLCSSLKTTLKTVYNRINQSEEFGLSGFFKSNNYHIPTLKEIQSKHTKDEVANTLLIAEMCESYSLGRPPVIPRLSDDDNKTLTDMCWGSARLQNNSVYHDRLRRELDVIIKNGLSGYFLIIQDVCDWARKQNILLGAGRGCLHPETPIYTASGIVKSIKDITIDDKIIDRNGNPQSIKQIHKYECKEKLLCIKTYFGDSSLNGFTYDHKILAEKVTRPKNYDNFAKITKQSIKGVLSPNFKPEFIQAQNLATDDWLVCPIPKFETRDINVIDLAEFSNDSKPFDKDYVYREYTNPLTKTKKIIDKNSRYIQFNNDFAKILGLFMGDGWFFAKSESLIGFAFNPKSIRKAKNRDFLINWCNLHNIRFSIAKSTKKSLEQITLFSYHLKKLLESYFNKYQLTSQTKHVPDIIFNLPKEKKQAFLEGYAEADGSFTHNRITLCSTSKDLLYQIKLLYNSLGIAAGIRNEQRVDSRGFKSSRSYYLHIPHSNANSYFVKVTEDYIYMRIREIKEINNEYEYVCDISVDHPTEHNYLTSSYIVHNSAAGCLISYLVGITQVDPIQYDLIFERFYNEGRNTKGKVSLPDIDTDFEKGRRGEVIQYIKDKFGHDKVGHIMTISTLQGRGALKEVLRVYDACSQFEMNTITKNIPQEAEISDELENMRQEKGYSSIIEWTLENDPKAVEAWAKIENDKIVGEYSKYFELAIKIEGAKKNVGQHASGIIVSNTPLEETIPIINHSGELICGMEMGDLEQMGLVKLDILGLNTLSKIKATLEAIAEE